MSPDASRLIVDDENPWPGLASFDESAEHFFNGRTAETIELHRLVLQGPLTVLFGASGLGKTSLLQAGLFPALRREGILPIYLRLDVLDRTAPLIQQLTRALEREIRAQDVDAPALDPDGSPWRYLHRTDFELWSAQNKLLTPLFVLDQFEEVFTLGADNAAAIAQLRTDLADLIENRLPRSLANTLADDEGELSLDRQRYKVVLSFREDFLPIVEGWKRELPSIMRNRFRLVPMTGEQAFEAVHRTAPQLVDERMAEQIVRFVAAAHQDGPERASEQIGELAVEPALLSLVCHGLNERRKAQGKRSFDEALLKHGGLSIVSEFYERSLADLPDRVQRFIERELITERGYRKPCDVDDARTEYGVTERELRVLVDRRLLRIEPQRGTERVELTHDLLTPIVREHRDRQRQRERTNLYRKRIAALSALGVVLAALVIVFFIQFRNADTQRRAADDLRLAAQQANRRLKDTLDQLAKSVDTEQRSREVAERSAHQAEEAAAAAQTAQEVAEHQTHISTAQRLASQAEAALDRFPQRAALVAAEAVNYSLRRGETPVSAAEESLRVALATVGGIGFGGAGTLVYDAAISPDERWIAAHTGDIVHLRDLTGARAQPVVRLGGIKDSSPKVTAESRGRYAHVTFTSGGRFLVVTGLTSPHVWDVSRQTPVRIELPPAPQFQTLFSLTTADGDAVLGIAEDRSIVVWDLPRTGAVPPPVVVSKASGFRIQDRRGQPLPRLSENFDEFMSAAMGDLGLTTIEHVDAANRIIVATELGLPAVSPDKRWALVVADDGVCLLNVSANEKCDAQHVLTDVLSGGFPRIVFSADSRKLAIGNADGRTQVWNTDGSNSASLLHREVRRTNEDETATAGVAISPHGRWMVTARLANSLDPNRSPGTSAWLWDLDAPNPETTVRTLSGNDSGVDAIAITDQWAIVGSETGVIRLWRLGDADPAGRPTPPSPPVVLRGHEGPIARLTVGATGHRLLSHSRDGSVRTWDLLSPQSSTTPLEMPSTATAVSPDGHFAALDPGGSSPIEIVDLRSQTAARIAVAGTGNRGLTAFDFSQDSHWLLVIDDIVGSRLIDLTQVGSGTLTARPLDSRTDLRKVAFSPDHRWLAIGVSNLDGQEVRLWRLDRSPAPPVVLRDLKKEVTAVEFDAASRWLAASSNRGAAVIWRLDTVGTPRVTQIINVDGKAFAARFTANGRWFATNAGGEMRFWDVSRDVPVDERRMTRTSGSADLSLRSSPDGRWMISSGRGFRLWDLRGAPDRVEVHWLGDERTDYPGSQIVFDPASRRLITEHADHMLRVWDLTVADPSASPTLLRSSTLVRTLTLSADGRWLAATAQNEITEPPDPTIHLWDLAAVKSGSGAFTLLGHERSAAQVVFSPDGKWLISGAADAMLRFWDLHATDPSAAPMTIPAGGGINALTIDPSGRFVVSDHRTTARLWHLRVNELMELAQDAAGRNLSIPEWSRFFQKEQYRRTFSTLPDAITPPSR